MHKAAFLLVLVGAINWGLIGLLGFNLVYTLLGWMPTLERLVYILVGLAAVAVLLKAKCKKCMHGSDKDCCAGSSGKDCCGGDKAPQSPPPAQHQM